MGMESTHMLLRDLKMSQSLIKECGRTIRSQVLEDRHMPRLVNTMAIGKTANAMVKVS